MNTKYKHKNTKKYTFMFEFFDAVASLKIWQQSDRFTVNHNDNKIHFFASTLIKFALIITLVPE